MFSKIIKQIWNQRRMNGWIFIEVIIAGFFLWTVIDPMYVLMVNHWEDKGYQEEGRYILQLGAYGSNHGKRDTTITKVQRKEAFLRIAQLVKDQPEVDSYYICLYRSLPNTGSWNGGQLFPDTASIAEKKHVHTQQFYYYSAEGSDMLRTLGIKDANTDEEMRTSEKPNSWYVSEEFAKKMYGTTQAVGKRSFYDGKNYMEIDGVFKDIKTRDFQASYPLTIQGVNDFVANEWMHKNTLVIFRLKEGVNFETFNERFKREVAPHMSQGNFYFNGFQSFADSRKELGIMFGAYNQIRLKGSLAIFTLLCIFLGMVGTFWIRCNARRQEIGLMRSLGATEGRVKKQFLTEACLLVSVAFVFSLLLVVNFVVMADGMSQQNVTGDIQFAHISQWLSPGVQFCIVSFITYLLLLGISLIGTLIPVSKAAKVLPADALRDE